MNKWMQVGVMGAAMVLVGCSATQAEPVDPSQLDEGPAMSSDEELHELMMQGQYEVSWSDPRERSPLASPSPSKNVSSVMSLRADRTQKRESLVVPVSR